VLPLTAAVFIVMTNRGVLLTQTKQATLPKEKPVIWTMTALDRCDTGSCGSQAYVMVKGISGELYFCSHHYNKIMESPKGYERMMSFMLEIIDERDKLIENRLKGN
jgi:hypothetical protein